MFELMLAAMWLVQGPEGQTRLYNTEPPPAVVWPGSTIKFHKDLQPDTAHLYEMKDGEIQLKPAPQPIVATEDELIQAAIDEALKTRADDPALTDLDYARLSRMKFMSPEHRKTEWDKIK
ncbi:MAG: hypothetical protein K2W95_00790 [Candidatus Obscuribacterales bacterium]|nr:hypothetical protein [Candidatus Obscuribacterales bacterium]